MNPELCLTQLRQSPSYWNTDVTGLSYRSCVLHMSIPVAVMQPARPSMDRRKPTTWHVVVDMALGLWHSGLRLGTSCHLPPVEGVGLPCSGGELL